MELEVTFKGDLSVIPPGSALILRTEHLINADQAEKIRDYVKRHLGQDQRVLVIGPDLTASAIA